MVKATKDEDNTMSEMGYPQPSPKVFLIKITMDAVQRLDGSGLFSIIKN